MAVKPNLWPAATPVFRGFKNKTYINVRFSAPLTLYRADSARDFIAYSLSFISTYHVRVN